MLTLHLPDMSLGTKQLKHNLFIRAKLNLSAGFISLNVSHLKRVRVSIYKGQIFVDSVRVLVTALRLGSHLLVLGKWFCHLTAMRLLLEPAIY